jgi:hypothetical protein
VRTLLALTAVVACGGGDDSGTTFDEVCGIAAPVVQSVSVIDCGMHTFEEEGEVPGLLVEAVVTDADGDLSSYGMQVFWDEELDGEVTIEVDYYVVLGTFEGAPRCQVAEATLAMWIGITDLADSPAFGIETELGVVVLDESYNTSGEPVELIATMPNTLGECG